MNVNAVFTPPSRPDPTPRTDVASRTEDPDNVDETRDTPEKRVPTRAEFSALMALLAGAGTKVRADLLKQVPTQGAGLIDTLLEGGALIAGDESIDPNALVASLPASAGSSSQQAADALRYGILKDTNATGVNDLDLLQSALADTKMLGTAPTRGASGEERAHFNEIVGRIMSRNGSSVDQLKARGDERGADVREALDALLATAGTPSGLELASVPANAAMAAAAAALAAANAKSAADVSTPVKDTSALHPQLQQKLNRVIERMQNEYGNDVSVVETARSQERQDFLYEQGRARPGNIVTWTQNSAHTRGEAVDVIVDGSYTNAEGFARLQRIAKEEGLRTLGVRDPGHLELSASDKGVEGALGALSSTATKQPARDVTPLIATSAGQAGVARVAGVAGVAGVARVADGGGFDRRYSARVDSPSNGNAALANATVVASTNGQGHGYGRGERDEQGRPMNDGKKLGNARRESLGNAEVPAFGVASNATPLNASNKTEAAPTAAGVAAAERVANIQDLRDNAPAGSVSRLTLDIDAPNGGQDRITVDLRGANVGTQINTDATNAERLRMRTAELQDALGRHGLESDTVRISSAGRNETMDAARVVANDRDGIRLNAAQQSASSDSAMNQGQRDRSANAREWDRPENPRQPRGEQQDTARERAGQRGQRDSSNGSAYGSAT